MVTIMGQENKARPQPYNFREHVPKINVDLYPFPLGVDPQIELVEDKDHCVVHSWLYEP